MGPSLRTAAALLCLGSLAACLRPSSQRAALTRFPIGIYNIGDPKLLGPLRESGFDSFYAFAPNAQGFKNLAQEARRRGMRMMMLPNALLGQPSSITRGWPVEAWYLQDEPDVNRVPVGALAAMSRKTRQWDPDRPQSFVVGQGSAAQEFGRVGDIFMLDWYPVPHLKLDSVADQIDTAYRSLPAGKPLWMVVQAFDWREDPQRDPKKPRIGRFPDRAEIRFMSWLAVVHGAKGLFYFRLERPGGRTLFDFPELWQAVAGVAREMQSMQPILEKGSPEPPPFSPRTDGVEAKAWRYHGRDYVVVLNRREKDARDMPDELLKPEWRALFETRRDPKDLLVPGGASWRLRPSQVMVLESGLRWWKRS